MTNLEALRSWCTNIASTFYADLSVMERAMLDSGIERDEEYTKFNVEVLKCALELVQGFVNTLQIEGDVHNNTNWDAVRANIIRISRKYNLDPSDYIMLSVVSDASEMW